jgi:hypothetical protein
MDVNAPSGTIIAVNITAAHCRVTRCFIDALRTGTPAQEYRGINVGSTATGTTYITGCYIINFRDGSGNKGRGIVNSTNTTVYAYNNTLHYCYYGMYRPGGTFVAVNNLGTSCSTAFNSLTAAGTSNNVASGVTYVASPGDWHLDTTDTGARGQGLDLSATYAAAANGALDAIDADGDNLPVGSAWDCGADQYTSGGNYPIVIEAGGVTVGGGDPVTFYKSTLYSILIESLGLTVAGLAATPRWGNRTLSANGLTVTVIGDDSGSFFDYECLSDPGSVSVAGLDVMLTRSIGGIVCEAGEVTVSGESSDSEIGYNLQAQGHAVTVAGFPAVLEAISNREILTEEGAITIANPDLVILTLTRLPLTVESGNVDVDGSDITLTWGKLFNLVTEQAPPVQCAGQDATLTYHRNKVVSADQLDVTVAGSTVTFARTYNLVAGASSISVGRGSKTALRWSGGHAQGGDADWFIVRNRGGKK